MVNADNIPDEMKQYDHWIAWETGIRNGKETKLPRAPWEVGHTGSVPVNDPEVWGSFEEAWDWVSKMSQWGIGFVFAESDPFVGIDLDDCITDDGLMPSATDILSRVPSFAEVSPSGNGVHIICLGELDHALKNDERGVELYDRDRFFTVTGDVLGDEPREIIEAQEAVDFLMDEYMIDQDEPPSDQADLDTSVSGDMPDMPSGDRHPIYTLSVSEVYPSITAGENTSHPIHGSTTGANFKIHDSSPTAVCWRGEHQSGTKMGCVLCAWHMLAMEGLGEDNCRRVRRHYATDDEMVFAAWKEAYEQGFVTGHNPPWRAVNYIAETKGIDGHLAEGGKGAWAVYRACCRLIRHNYEIPVKIGDE